MEDFFNVNIFFKCKLNINVSINNHSLYLRSMLFKTLFLLPHLFHNVDLLNTDLDLFRRPWFDTDIPVNILFIYKASSRHVFKTCLEDMSSRRLQHNNFLSSKTSSRRLQRWKIVTLKTCWTRLQEMSSRRLQDVFKTKKCLLGYHVWRNI